MSNTERSKQIDPEIAKKNRFIAQRYSRRLQVLKKAQEFSQNDNVVEAIKYYLEYLDILAKYHDTNEEKLAPHFFDDKQELAEIFLISHVYWDLAKAYDRSLRLHKESARCLQQFVKFTVNFKFQYINSELIKKFLKKRMAHHPKNFEKAYHDIKVNSKQCFLATYCFGPEHYVVSSLRDFKVRRLNHSRFGTLFIAYYYSFSPKLINFCRRYPLPSKLVVTTILRPGLFLLAKALNKFV